MDSITGYHIHRYVALSVIGHRMCNRISGLCDKSSITIVTKRYRETSLVCCLRYYYSCCALVIIRGNQLVIFPGIALYYGNTSILYSHTDTREHHSCQLFDVNWRDRKPRPRPHPFLIPAKVQNANLATRYRIDSTR